MAFIKVATVQEIPAGQAKKVRIGNKDVAIFNMNGTFFALDDSCPHRGGPLSEGELDGQEVTCPWHGAVFDVTTGSVLGAPAPRDVAHYAVRIAGGDIELEL